MKRNIIARTGGLDLAMQCLTPSSSSSLPEQSLGTGAGIDIGADASVNDDLTIAAPIGSQGVHPTQVP